MLAEFHRIGMDEDRVLFERFPAAYLRDPDWAKGSRGLGRMTKRSSHEFFDAYIALLMKYSHRAEDAPRTPDPCTSGSSPCPPTRIDLGDSQPPTLQCTAV